MSTPLLSAALEMLDQPLPAPAAPLSPPDAGEHDPYYSAYISCVPPGDFLAMLQRQAHEVAALFGGLTPAQAAFAYAPDKWTLAEVLGHLIDTERVFVYRATSMARRDPSPLPGFSQDDWMPAAGFAGRPTSSLVTEWLAVRVATIAFTAALPAGAPMQRGVASGRGFSVRSLLYIPPGHVNYHLKLVHERYRGATGWPA
jgi:hypothetical protein